MELERQLPVRLLQLRVAGVLRHAQDFVVVVTFAYPAKMSIFGATSYFFPLSLVKISREKMSSNFQPGKKKKYRQKSREIPL